MSVRVCPHVWVVCTYACACVCGCVHTHACARVCHCVCMCTCAYACVCMCVYMHMLMCAHVCVAVCACMHAFLMCMCMHMYACVMCVRVCAEDVKTPSWGTPTQEASLGPQEVVTFSVPCRVLLPGLETVWTLVKLQWLFPSPVKRRDDKLSVFCLEHGAVPIIIVSGTTCTCSEREGDTISYEVLIHVCPEKRVCALVHLYRVCAPSQTVL